ETQDRLKEHYASSIKYNRRVGNVYSASLYLSLISLLENSNLKEDSKLGLFSYGSGAVGEFFTMRLLPNYKDHLLSQIHVKNFNNRRQVSVHEYEEIFVQSLPTDGSTVELNI